MITTGIIREINLNSDKDHSNNLYNVEIGILKTPISTSNDAILQCTCCLPGGVYNSYKVGDVVYIGFVNNLLNYPVILGRIYKGLNENETRSFNKLEDLEVSNSVILPENIHIGDLSYSDLKKLILDNQNLANSIEQINTYMQDDTYQQTEFYSRLTALPGFDVTKEQTLKNINGQIRWE